MSLRPVIAVVRQRPDLFHAVIENFPDLKVVRIDADGSIEPHQGAMLCFVEWTGPNATETELCASVRRLHGPEPRIIIVLSEDTDQARRQALLSGADDYVVGPLLPRHLKARLTDYLGTGTQASGPDVERHGSYTINRPAQKILHDDRALVLQPSEFALLGKLLNNCNRLLTLPAIIELVGRDPQSMQERTVHVWMGRLRRSLQNQGVPNPIRSVRGVGYVFDL